MTRLHIFDMDGTLLMGTSASAEISRQIGTSSQVRELEKRFAAGEVDTRGFAAAIHALWRDLTPEMVADAYARANWIDGIAAVCADIRARGERSMVITMSPDFFAEHLYAEGFDSVVGSRFPPPPFASTLDPVGILTFADKVRIAEEQRRALGLTRIQCVAYGDSMSDAPLFRHLSTTIAINADHHLADIAAADYRGDDLIEAYALARSLLA